MNIQTYLYNVFCIFFILYSFSNLLSLDRCEVINIHRDRYHDIVSVEEDILSNKVSIEKVTYVLSCSRGGIRRHTQYHIDKYGQDEILYDEPILWISLILLLLGVFFKQFL